MIVHMRYSSKYSPLLLFLCFLIQGCKERYEIIKISDHALFNGSLYMLAVKEEGINLESRLSHSSALKCSKRTVALLRYTPSSKLSFTNYLVGKVQFVEEQAATYDSFRIVNTNAIVLQDGAGNRRILLFANTNVMNKAMPISSKRVVFTSNRNWLLGCSSNLWAMNAHSLEIDTNLNLNGIVNIACDFVDLSGLNKIAISDDLKFLALQDYVSKSDQVSVVSFDQNLKTNLIFAPKIPFDLRSIQPFDSSFLIVGSTYESSFRRRFYLINEDSDVITSKELFGYPEIALGEGGIAVLSPALKDLDASKSQGSFFLWDPFSSSYLEVAVDIEQIIGKLK